MKEGRKEGREGGGTKEERKEGRKEGRKKINLCPKVHGKPKSEVLNKGPFQPPAICTHPLSLLDPALRQEGDSSVSLGLHFLVSDEGF